MNSLKLIVALSFFGTSFAFSKEKAKDVVKEKTEVSFVSPKNGEAVGTTFKIQFGLSGMKIRPAGEDVKDKTSGHHHLIIDGDFIPEGQVVPTDDTHKHFGKGQVETELTLTKGKHKLTLQLADGAHLSYGKNMSTTIEVSVK